MRRIIPLFCVALVVWLSGCENLDRELVTDITGQQLIKSYDYTLYRLNSLYTNIPAGYLQIDGAMTASATDEAEHTLETSNVQKFNNGSWNAIDNPDNLWANFYQGIRKTNQFLVSTDSVNLDQYKLDPAPSAQALYQSRLSDIKRWKYEARFLRAYFYFELVKRYGGVPIIAQIFDVDDNFQNVKRNTLAECMQYITSECDSAAKNLPITYAATDLGRATRGAALALKSRALLYAASDLFNTTTWAGGYSNLELISLTGDRQARWKAAADAAKAVIDLAGTGYALNTNYRNLFITNSYTLPEIILSRRNSASNEFEKANYPIGYDLGNSGTTPSQNLVDAYEMSNGTKFDWNNPVHAANPFANRDPRLGLNIILNNTAYKGRNVEAWAGGRDGKGIVNATKTGYYLKKYVNENLNLLLNNTSVYSWNLFRLAEIYLNYAEALNEVSPGSADIKSYIDKVRTRTGVALPALPTGLSQAEMRERIRNERRVELAFEDHRGWDVRRWLQGPQYLGAPLMGVDITKNADGTFKYTPITVENRVFEPKMYLYPIPQGELNASKGLIQNPGW
ncbi:RagB/SusD family nutrient uptake outer membrane protein [Spirosoma sp. KNUC1025]|uniref:RagB/SusD family nutrient uptake outer membrane protein n=1 Tax=Spirosoma sp. KNUC1025 TaxID=2894082 RepID=UPI001E4C4FE1|nr:RagB/SusD family nutrient uptake outer membrane protein [Spirosoma sp. KNUC1025]UFH57959.1 RagB/SusD family nutrient uptake outer membrane protein [Spirosoma sp. KNUC1025]